MADANTFISAQHCESSAKPTKVTNHQRQPLTDGKTVKIIQKTTSESLRLSMSNNLFDGSVANTNTNGTTTIDTNNTTNSSDTTGGAINVGQAFGQRPVATSLPAQTTATLLMTNNGKIIQPHTSSPFVTLSDIGMDLKPKPSSFQITSITVGTRTSADDDSADDLDESHTTDENSRITDMENETPSYSEDTYSKDDVFAAAYAHGMVPIIQKSADLSNCVNNNVNNTNNNNNSNLTNNNNSNNINNSNNNNNAGNSGSGNGGKKLSAGEVRVSVATAVDKNKGVEIKGSERFKVVKIESIEPFKRGRWTCMDYLDQSAKQMQMNFGAGNGAGGANAGAGAGAAGKNVNTSDSGVVLTENFNCDASAPMLNNNNTNVNKKKTAKVVHTDMMQNQMNQSAVPVNHIVGQSAPVAIQTIETNMSPGQTLQQPMNMMHMNQTHSDQSGMLPNTLGHVSYAANVTTSNTFQPVNTIPGQSLPQQQLHQILTQQAQGVSFFLPFSLLSCVRVDYFLPCVVRETRNHDHFNNNFKISTATANADNADAVSPAAVCKYIIGW